MAVRELGNRILKIYAFTILFGTLVSSLIIGLISASFGFFILAFFVGGIFVGIISLPNILLLNLGLKYIYAKSQSKQQKSNYFIYLWLLLCAIPLSIIIVYFIGVSISFSEIFNPETLLPVPYMLSSIYFLFYVNNDYDKRYPPNYNSNLPNDILDADLD